MSCNCSKPAPGLLLEATSEFGLDLRQSFVVGDKRSDIAAGRAAGCRTLLVLTGKGGAEADDDVTAVPDVTTSDLLDAVNCISRTLESSSA